MVRRIFIFIYFLLYAGIAFPQTFIFNDGKSDYSIIVGTDASQSERTAAEEFQHYIELMSGVRLPLQNSPTLAGHHIYIGYNDILFRKGHIVRPSDNDETFTYQTFGNDLFIYGGRQHGTSYGVYSFLEKEMGVRWYTSDFTKVPRMKRFAWKPFYRTERPVFKYRLDYFFQSVRDKAWLSHNLLNACNVLSESKYGRLSSLWGVHTFAQLIPSSDYFASHPEYFGLYKGQRTDKTQLCLSNAEMFKELVHNLRNVIQEKPGYWCYDVSQNDNRFPCECSECAKLVRKYGGQSGILLWFVNKVAAEINKTNPDLFVSTLAYQYTRQAPTSSISPADNVVIRLCDIECCQAHPLEECEENKNFLKDMDNWKRIAKNITVWDYTTGFRHYLMPFPNFEVLGRNYQYFSKSNVIGILELGSWNAPWSEFSELKQWVVAKLLWNPLQNTDSLVNLFINDYYGKSASYVKNYYDLCLSRVTADKHFTVGMEWDTNLYDYQFMTDAAKLLKKAVAASRDEVTRKRTNRLAAQIYYMQLRRQTARSLTNGTSDKLKDIIKSDSTLIREYGKSIDELIDDLSYY